MKSEKVTTEGDIRARNNRESLFFVCMAMIGIFSLVFLLCNPGHLSDWFLFMDKEDTFMDFFNPIYHACFADPYIEVDRIYPALCYVMYWAISRFIPQEVLDLENGKVIRSSQEGLFVFAVTQVIVLVFVTIVLYQLYQGKKSKKLYFSMTVLFSAPFLYEYERANIILLSFALVCYFYIYKDSENVVMRECALLLLGMSFAIKLYPAIMGFLLLKDRRWKDSIKCALYGLSFFFVPFAFMGRGKGFVTWIESLQSGATNTLSIGQGVGYKVNFSNFYVTVKAFANDGLITKEMIQEGGSFALIISIVVFVSLFMQREEWKQIAMATAIIIGFPGFSFQYCMIFMALPLAVFLTKKSQSRGDYFYAFLFVLMLSTAIFPNEQINVINGQYPLTVTVLMEEVGLAVMAVALVVDTVVLLFARGKRNNKKQTNAEVGHICEKQEDPLVSICIPVFNGERTIRETICSVINQTYKNIEIVVVDNCSTDHTMDVIHSLDIDNMTVYQNSNNLGMVGNWNRCLSLAKGKYICILCADDTIEKDCIRKKVNMMEIEKDLVMCFSSSVVVNERGEVLLRRRPFKSNCVVDGKELALRSYYSKNLYGEPSNVLFKKDVIKEAVMFDGELRYATDWDMWLQLSCLGQVGYIDEVLMKYKISKSNQTSSTGFKQMIKDDNNVIENFHNNPNIDVNFFDDVFHRIAFVARMYARWAFMIIRA